MLQNLTTNPAAQQTPQLRFLPLPAYYLVSEHFYARSRFRGMAVLSLYKTTILRKFFVENHTTSEAAATHVPASDELEELG